MPLPFQDHMLPCLLPTILALPPLNLLCQPKLPCTNIEEVGAEVSEKNRAGLGEVVEQVNEGRTWWARVGAAEGSAAGEGKVPMLFPFG